MATPDGVVIFALCTFFQCRLDPFYRCAHICKNMASLCRKAQDHISTRVLLKFKNDSHINWGLTNKTGLHIITVGNYMEEKQMNIKTIKTMFDAFYQAKRIRDLLPALPQGVTPSYIHFLDTIESLERQGTRVKVSDISDALNIPRPGVTRTVKEMEAKGYLCKHSSASDGRITYISITEAGKQLSQRYNEQYFNRLAPFLSDISQADADCTIQTIDRFYHVMSERRISVD